ncbi:MAG TPA: response regulator [Blastocatellia bacterium]|nr:response regulator [Blastocatellia bacterium]
MTPAKKILIVEDSEDVRRMLVRLLETASYSVLTASDGVGGLQTADGDRPDLIITDLNMPRLDGVQMITMLRALPDYDHVPIIALTASGGDVLTQATEAGADVVANKPLDVRWLLDTIARLLAESKPRQSRAGC